MSNKEVKLGRKLEGFAEFFGKYLIVDAIMSWVIQKIIAIVTLYLVWKYLLKPFWQAATGQPVTF